MTAQKEAPHYFPDWEEVPDAIRLKQPVHQRVVLINGKLIPWGVMGGPAEQWHVAETPLGRVGKPDDIANVAVFLASQDAYWVNGELIAVSGGQR